MILGLCIYSILQVLFIPFGIVGAIITYYKQMFVSKKLGVSQTAIEILNGRWTMDKFGLRKDPASVKLFNVLPNTTGLGLWLALFPLYILNRIAGRPMLYPTIKEDGNESLANLVTSRTVYFDSILKNALSSSEQFVVLGAGFDTRCYGGLMKEDLALFELDQKSTQDLKVEYLQKAQIDSSKVNFVDVDFATEHWYEKLSNAGYDSKKRTTFLWEGVTLYLSEDDVRKTLREIKRTSALGSTLVADFYSTQFVNGDLLPGKKRSLDQLKLTNEEFGFGVGFEGNNSHELKTLVESEGLSIGEIYYMGYRTKKGTWMAVVEVVV